MDHRKLSSLLSAKLDIDGEQTEKLFSTLAACIGEEAAELNSVNIPSFGAFEPRRRAERVISQPSTGKKLLVPPKVVLGFKPSVILKQKIK